MASQIPLFRSPLQARLLHLALTNPEREWTSSELAERLSASPVTLHRELQRGLAEGLLERTNVGRTFLYRAATASPLFEPLSELLNRTVGIEPELRSTLGSIPGVQSAFIHGSFARGTKVKPQSDVDVLVIGSPDPHILRRKVQELEARLGRRIDVVAYESEEFRQLAKRGNSFVRQFAKGPVIALVGTSADIPQAAG